MDRKVSIVECKRLNAIHQRTQPCKINYNVQTAQEQVLSIEEKAEGMFDIFLHRI